MEERIAVSRIDEALGQNRVPFATRAVVNGTEGIASRWIDGKDLSLLSSPHKPPTGTQPEVIQAALEARVFDFLIGQYDRKYGERGWFHNLFAELDADKNIKRVWFIDQELAFSPRFEEDPESWLASLPAAAPNPEMIQRLREIDEPKWTALLEDVLTPHKLQKFFQRRALLLEKYP